MAQTSCVFADVNKWPNHFKKGVSLWTWEQCWLMDCSAHSLAKPWPGMGGSKRLRDSCLMNPWKKHHPKIKSSCRHNGCSSQIHCLVLSSTWPPTFALPPRHRFRNRKKQLGASIKDQELPKLDLSPRQTFSNAITVNLSKGSLIGVSHSTVDYRSLGKKGSLINEPISLNNVHVTSITSKGAGVANILHWWIDFSLTPYLKCRFAS